MELFDAHTHLDLKHYRNDLDQVVERAREAGIVGMVTSSISPDSFRRTQKIVDRYKGLIFHTAGCSVSQLTPNEADEIVSFVKKHPEEIVAIGEVGLDYHWVRDARGRKLQEPLFQMFIDLAREYSFPLVIHSRKAEAEAVNLLEKQFDGPVLMHCFDGPPEVTRRVSDNGWLITLPANFAKYRNRIKAAKSMPLEQIVLETDGPYLSPMNGRNEPANLRYGCRDLAELLAMDIEEVARETTTNARRFYDIKAP